jgi:hypothetical protein
VWFRIFFATGLLFALAACGPTVADSVAGELAKDAKPLLENGCRNALRTIGPDQWPPSIAALRPEQVSISLEGLEITTRSFFVASWGVFIPCHPDSFAPVPGGDPAYTEVRHDVYTFYIAG